LNEMPMGTFDFTRANGEFSFPRTLVVEVSFLWSSNDGGANRSFRRAVLRFEVVSEAAQHFGELVV